jgi:hypothetical protein
MARSGTSATARLLVLAGLALGDEFNPPREDNRLGYYEDRVFYELDKRLIAAGLANSETRKPNWMYAEDIEFDRLTPFVAEAKRLVSARGERGRAWGFKDPRISVLLPFWEKAAPGAGYLFVYRAPWDVLDSLLRLERRPLAGRATDCMKAWLVHNRALLDFANRNRQRCALLHVAALQTAPEQVLENANRVLLQIGSPPADPLEGTAYVPSLLTTLPRADLRAAVVADLFPDALRLYDELEAVADLPAAASDERPVPAVTESGLGRLPIHIVAIGRSIAPGDALSAISVGSEPSPAAAANRGVSVAPPGTLAVVFAGQLTPGVIEAAVASLTPDVGAVVLGASVQPQRFAVQPLHIWSFLGGRVDVRGIVIRRDRWEACGGFDATLPSADLDAWALAIAVLDSGYPVLHIRGALTVSAASRPEEALRALALGHVAERHARLFARYVLADSEGSDRFELLESLERQVARLEEELRQLKHAATNFHETVSDLDRERRLQATAAAERLALAQDLEAQLQRAAHEAEARLRRIHELERSIHELGQPTADSIRTGAKRASRESSKDTASRSNPSLLKPGGEP